MTEDVPTELLAVEVDRRSPQTVVVRPAGELDMLTVPELQRCLAEHLHPGTRVVVDTGGLSFCGSAGLHALTVAAELAQASNAELRVVVAPDGLLDRIFDLNGMHQVVSPYPDLDRALEP